MITELRMSPITDEILERCWDYLLPVKVDDIASRLGVTIRPLDEDLCKDYSGFAFVDSTTRLKHIYYNQRGMRTKSWTPLLILTKSEPVLYRAQSS